MRICILCEDSNVDLARENGKSVLSESVSPNRISSPLISKIKENMGIPEKVEHLSIPLSPNGEMPATHWFCFVNVTEEGYTRLKSVQEHTTIEESSPKEFLAKWNLQIIRKS